MNKQERRYVPSAEMRISETGSRTISGYASVANQLSEDLGGFYEEILSGAFKDCLSSDPDVRHLIDHDSAKILGRTKAGTLRLKEDDHGLHFECDLPETQVAKDLMVSIARGDISQCSFGFVCTDDKWRVDKATGRTIRSVVKANLFDTSCVSYPAYLGTSVSLRSLFPDDKGQLPAEITEKLAELRSAQSAKENRIAIRNKRSIRSVVNFVTRTPWAILPEKLEAINSFLNDRANGKSVSKDEVKSSMMGFDDYGFDDESSSSAESNDLHPGVAVIPVYGVVSQKSSIMDDWCGGASVEKITKNFRAALADDSVKSIVFDIDSPGGTVTGVPELAAEIFAARDQKPSIAVANGMAASAAYWIFSACSQGVVIPSGEVGSIGVYCTHQDVSSAMEKAGVKITFIKAGANKTAGNPYEAPSKSYLADAQAMVDAINVDFTNAVAKGRGVSAETVSETFGQGKMFLAKDALALGMVDSIQTFDEVVAGLVAAQQAEVAVQETGMNAATVAGMECNCECVQCMAGNHLDCTETTGCDYDGHTVGPDDTNAQVAKVDMSDSTCSCMCPECMAGDHEDCTGTEDGCDFEDDFDDDDDDEEDDMEMNRVALKAKVMQMFKD